MSDSALQRWASSGAMALTGQPDEALGPPDGLVERIVRLGSAFAGLDSPALLGERAALMGLWRRGAVSCGGSCRLFASDDAWVAVSLPRAEDMEAVPAWLELDTIPATAPAVWSAVEAAFARRDPAGLLACAALLGLPVAVVGEAHTTEAGGGGVERVALGPARAREVAGALVVDLSALWAGPLCGDLLAGEGAAVVKVESTRRPDGARRGSPAFYDLLNGRKRSVAFDFGSAEGIAALRRLVTRADVVIEASRPRALEQLGVVAHNAVREGGPQVWVSITGYGRGPHAAQRVGFGDDTAAAGGLVAWSGAQPLFCADAVADPVTGLTAAHACLEALADGGRWLLDISMAGVAAGVSGPTLAAPAGLIVAEPRARVPARVAPGIGADTARVMSELGLTG